ncbi:hypothetical protein INT48_002575 [Thamnidium elegans]|uniref:Uncharacterized protein n=1 Tax=Thamnidium elegans TaxID=101142 RepID=A0A8H7W0C1_9FUNG|nr:hypothetical protein INT48_002575 [Thamnidium elegans]
MNYNNIYLSNDVLKNVESLRTRLGFARFKLNNGWENNTLGDVECFWKQKQRQSIRDIPTPRFTQQDIIDKRSYIQASGAKYAKARRYRLLNRSLSNPSSKQDLLNFVSPKSIKKVRRKSHPPPSQQYLSNDEDEDDDESSNSSTISSPTQQTQSQPLPQEQQYYFHHYDKEAWDSNKDSEKPIGNHSVSSFDASCVPTDLNGEPTVVKNSLDYLSYAIAMTEKDNDDWKRPSSPTNLAAQAMLMFLNRNEPTA